MTRDLKPCPFCGEEEDLHVYEYGKGTDNCDCFVQCQGCSATGRASEIDRQGAIDNWNLRTQPEATAPAPEPEFICEITEGTVRINPYGDKPIITGKRTYPVNIPAAQDLSAAILAVPCEAEGSTLPLRQHYAAGFHTALKAAAALASSANALSAGDRRDAERYRKIKDLTKEQYLAWRGIYGCSDEAIDAATLQSRKESQ